MHPMKSLILTLLLIPLAVLHSADSPTKPNAQAPSALLDLPYVDGGKASQRLDLFIPAALSKPAPLLVWIHGGGWREGDKRGHPMRAFAEHGFAIASINYRLTGEAVFPAQIDDVRAALKWLRAHATEYGYDSNRIGIIGHSAGGHLSALLGVSSLGDQAVQAVCVLSGPCDMQAMVEAAIDPKRRTAMESLFGTPLKDKTALIRSASPITQITRGSPPFLILHGEQDEVVPAALAQRFHEALSTQPMHPSLLIVLPKTSHDIFRNPQWASEAIKFFEATLKPVLPR